MGEWASISRLVNLLWCTTGVSWHKHERRQVSTLYSIDVHFVLLKWLKGTWKCCKITCLTWFCCQQTVHAMNYNTHLLDVSDQNGCSAKNISAVFLFFSFHDLFFPIMHNIDFTSVDSNWDVAVIRPGNLKEVSNLCISLELRESCSPQWRLPF